MYITRPRAKSFTVEVKRTGKRSTDPTSMPPKTSHTGSDLVDRVFGRFVTPSAGPLEKLARPHDKAEGSRPSQALTAVSVSENIRAREPKERRVLPDLLSVIRDPVEERMKQHAEQRAARRRALLESRRSKAGSASTETDCKDRVGPSDEIVPAAPQPRTSRKQKNHLLMVAMRNARRAGLRTPRLPIGQRWKRRLPQACW